MRYRRRRYSRRYRSYKTRYRRSYRRGFRRYRRSATNRTKSSTIKLTLDGLWTFRTGATTTTNYPVYNPFTFNVMNIPGFSQYLTTYSKFRILKAVLYVGRSIAGTTNSNSLTNNYLVVGSRPFANTRISPRTNSPSPLDFVPPKSEESLRQSRWQKVLYPKSYSTNIRVGFYPYTMISTGGPAWNWNASEAYRYQRVWESRKWMPLSWAGADGENSIANQAITFYGPYMVMDLQNVDINPSTAGELPATSTVASNVQLVVYCQFSGQS